MILAKVLMIILTGIIHHVTIITSYHHGHYIAVLGIMFSFKISLFSVVIILRTTPTVLTIIM